MKGYTRGFTIVEVVVIITVLAILAAVSVVGFGMWRQSIATTNVRSDLQHATSGLKSYQNFKNDYPPNLGGIDFAASGGVALKLSTNAQQVRRYSSGVLTDAENAQLFLNSCNAQMPIVDGATTYNGSCTFSGINLHVKGTSASNAVWNGPAIDQSEIALDCGAKCSEAVTNMLNEFIAQGGVFPLVIPKSNVPLPPYDVVLSEGPATRFCLEAVSADYGTIVYHTTSENIEVTTGPCPVDAELHYP